MVPESIDLDSLAHSGSDRRMRLAWGSSIHPCQSLARQLSLQQSIMRIYANTIQCPSRIPGDAFFERTGETVQQLIISCGREVVIQRVEIPESRIDSAIRILFLCVMQPGQAVRQQSLVEGAAQLTQNTPRLGIPVRCQQQTG